MNNKNMTNRATLLSEEQSAALQLMLSGRNVFLTGEAGTGKSTILHELRKRYGDEGIVFLAPTGMAASNIKGQTIHSFFRLTPGLLSPDTIEELGDSRTRMLLSEVQTVVIDEISMVRSDVFTAIDHRFREVACGENRNRPFAGKQVIVCGDFFQLPPIVSGDTEWAYLQKKLGGKYPFMTELWQKAEFEVVMLKEVHRQCSDPKFMEILRHIRHGEMDLCDLQLPGESKHVNCITALNKLCFNKKASSAKAKGVVLCTTRRETEEVNRRHATKLKTKTEVFNAQIEGIFLKNDYPTEAILQLNEGARVMTLVNKRHTDGSYEYINGDLGIISSIISNADGTCSVSVEFDDGRTSIIETAKWSRYQYQFERERNTGKEYIKQVEIGSFVQIPLRLAWAITIHKSQGLGFDQVELFLGNGCFDSGQLYTAVTRCRTLEGLRLKSKISQKDFLLDKNVVDFYRGLEEAEKRALETHSG